MLGAPGVPRPSARGLPDSKMLQPGPRRSPPGRAPRPCAQPARLAENNRRGPPPASPATSSTLAGRRALCDDPSPAGPGRRRPRAPARRCGSARGPVHCARGLRGTGRPPSPAALSRLSSGLSGAGAGHSAAIARSPGKDDLSTVRPRATTRLGFSNELGSRPAREE